jgi:hypothetical protein
MAPEVPGALGTIRNCGRPDELVPSWFRPPRLYWHLSIPLAPKACRVPSSIPPAPDSLSISRRRVMDALMGDDGSVMRP